MSWTIADSAAAARLEERRVTAISTEGREERRGEERGKEREDGRRRKRAIDDFAGQRKLKKRRVRLLV